jgi:hypothetical protein
MQPVWATACHIIVEEIRTAREGRRGELTAVFDRGFTAMRVYADSCPLLCASSHLVSFSYLEICVQIII